MLGRLLRLGGRRFEARHPFPEALWHEARQRVPLLADDVRGEAALRVVATCLD